MSKQLTVEQQKKIEENRRRALERRAQRLAQQSPSGNGLQPSEHDPPRSFSTQGISGFSHQHNKPPCQRFPSSGTQISNNTLLSSAPSKQVSHTSSCRLDMYTPQVTLVNTCCCGCRSKPSSLTLPLAAPTGLWAYSTSSRPGSLVKAP